MKTESTQEEKRMKSEVKKGDVKDGKDGKDGKSEEKGERRRSKIFKGEKADN